MSARMLATAGPSAMVSKKDIRRDQDSILPMDATDKDKMDSIDWADADGSGIYGPSSSTERDGVGIPLDLDSKDSLTDVALALEGVTPGAYQPPLQRTPLLNHDTAALKLGTAWYAKSSKVLFATSPTNFRKCALPLPVGSSMPNSSQSQRDRGSAPSSSDVTLRESFEQFQRSQFRESAVTPAIQGNRRTVHSTPTLYQINVKGQQKDEGNCQDTAETAQGLPGAYMIAGCRSGSLPTSRHKAATHKLKLSLKK